MRLNLLGTRGWLSRKCWSKWLKIELMWRLSVFTQCKQAVSDPVIHFTRAFECCLVRIQSGFHNKNLLYKFACPCQGQQSGNETRTVIQEYSQTNSEINI